MSHGEACEWSSPTKINFRIGKSMKCPRKDRFNVKKSDFLQYWKGSRSMSTGIFYDSETRLNQRGYLGRVGSAVPKKSL